MIHIFTAPPVDKMKDKEPLNWVDLNSLQLTETELEVYRHS